MSAEEHIALIHQVYAAAERGDLETFAAGLADDIAYEQPRQRLQGRAAVTALVRDANVRLPDVRVEFRHLVAQGEVVLSEEVHHFTVEGQAISLPVMCTLEFRDGRISAWRAYWDPQTVERQLRGES